MVIKLMRNTHNNDCESTTPYVTDWSCVKWNKVEKYVSKLQKRIFRAEREGDSHKVRDLQRMLVYSDSALLMAIKKVTQTNKGKRTPGIDGFRALTDKKRGELFDSMKNMNIKKHKPKPAFRMYIPKKNGKMRSLGIPIIKDRIYQEILRMALEPQAEAYFEPTSYGFRPKRGVFDAAERIFNNFRSGKWCYVYEGDFKSCFDTISHDFILKQIKGFPFYNVVKRFLEAGYVDNNIFNPTNKGTPQGGLLSPLLANIALHGMEEYLNITYSKSTKTARGKTYVTFETHGKYRMVRYADDFVIFAQNKKDIMEINEILKPYLEERGLSLALDKTKITHIHDGFDFLGLEFKRHRTKDGYKSLIKPSKDSIRKFKKEIDRRFKIMNGNNVDSLIDFINPMIRGTANYWRPFISSKIFNKMDNYIWKKTYKFLRRLHPHKGWNWIKKRYFPLYDDGYHRDKWVLTGPHEGNHIAKMSWVKIKRHVMIKYNYSPYDSSKSEYFTLRENNYKQPSLLG